MKKSYIIAGVVILACALGLIVYLNMKGPSKGAVGSDTNLSTQEEDHGSDTHSEDGHGQTHKTNGLDSMGKPADPKNQALENVVVNSRIAEEFRLLDEQMEAQYELIKKNASPEEIAIFERLSKQLKGDDLLNRFRDVLKEEFSEAELVQLNDIYKNPTYEKFKELESANRTPEGMKAIADFSKNFKMENLPAEKQAALKEYVRSSGAVDNMMKMMDSVEHLFAGDMGNSNQAEMKGYKDMLRKTFENATLAAAAYNFDKSDVGFVKEVTALVGNELHQREEAAKIGFFGKTVGEVVKPEIEQAKSQVNSPK